MKSATDSSLINDKSTKETRAFKCACCQATTHEPFLLKCDDRYLNIGEPIDYVKCSGCGLIQAFPIPDDLASLYQDYPIHQPRTSLVDKVRHKLLRPAYSFHKDIKSGDRILDYGCGDGWYLSAIKERNLSCFGFEMNVKHAQQLTDQLGLSVFSDSERMEEELGASLDWITMHFVMEHIPHPIPALSRCANLLKPNGQILITVPNIQSWEAGLFKKNWHGLDAPRHLVFPQENHIRTMAEPFGLELVRKQYIPFANTLAGSLATLHRGQFSLSAFQLLYPLSIIPTWIFPSGNVRYVLRKQEGDESINNEPVDSELQNQKQHEGMQT